RVAQEQELVERQRLRAPDFSRRIGRREVDLVPLVVAEPEDGRPDLETGALHEAAPVRAAAELAIGHHFEADVLLQAHHVADRVVLDGVERLGVDLARGELAERVAQALRPQQAAHVIGTERRPAFSVHAPSPGWPQRRIPISATRTLDLPATRRTAGAGMAVWEDGEALRRMTAPQLLLDHARATPARIAFRAKRRGIYVERTYRDYAALVAQC